MIVAATGLSGCMASALDVQSTFAPEPSVGLSLAGDDALPQPRPAEDLASADGSVQAPAGSASESPVMALEGAVPTEGAAAIAVDAAATGTTVSDEPATTVASAQPDTQPMTADGTGARPVDAATARIYSAAGTQAQNAAPPRPPVSNMGKRSGGLLSLFSNNRSNNTRKALIPPAPVAGQPATAELWSAPPSAPSSPPAVTVASASAAAVPGLPGVDRERALGLNTTETAPPPDELEDRPVQLASAAGLARLAPNGLIKQHDGVDVACLKPALVRVLKQVEHHYGRNVVITSGYRSPSRNKKARGAENSLHMYCSAADIQIEGVTKWELASYLRSMSGRGGVGTYCYTQSVHIDIGPQRDWNWRCRRRK
jgi:uncharacterized protein YcbK (DUF882 family)